MAYNDGSTNQINTITTSKRWSGAVNTRAEFARLVTTT